METVVLVLMYHILRFQDDQGKESPEPSVETGSDEEFDPRRRSAMF